MNKQALATRAVEAINQLPDDKAAEISNFVDFLLQRYEEHKLAKGIQQLPAESQSFTFLSEEEDLYTEADSKEVYNG